MRVLVVKSYGVGEAVYLYIGGRARAHCIDRGVGCRVSLDYIMIHFTCSRL